MSEPTPGVCCACGYADEEETPCPPREDGAHCNHWWDGPTEEEALVPQGHPSVQVLRAERYEIPLRHVHPYVLNQEKMSGVIADLANSLPVKAVAIGCWAPPRSGIPTEKE